VAVKFEKVEDFKRLFWDPVREFGLDNID